MFIYRLTFSTIYTEYSREHQPTNLQKIQLYVHRLLFRIQTQHILSISYIKNFYLRMTKDRIRSGFSIFKSKFSDKIRTPKNPENWGLNPFQRISGQIRFYIKPEILDRFGFYLKPAPKLCMPERRGRLHYIYIY